MSPENILILVILACTTVPFMFFGNNPGSEYDHIEPPTISELRRDYDTYNDDYSEEFFAMMVEDEEDYWDCKLKP